MADLHKYIFILVGLSILLTLAGFQTAMGAAFNAVYSSPGSFSSGMIAVVIAILGIAATASAIIIGYFTKSSSESIMIVSYASFILVFAYDWINLFSYSISNYPGYISAIIGLITIPIAFGFVHAVITWWAGRT
jgi:hypothetical protein